MPLSNIFKIFKTRPAVFFAAAAALPTVAGAAVSDIPALPLAPAAALQQVAAPAEGLEYGISSAVPAAEGELYAARAASGRSVVLKSTAYNSLAAQTDSNPYITATGTRTRPGVVALSRDMLRIFPYGTRLRIEPLNGSYPYLTGRTFIVEDTMHARKTNQVDIWMPTRQQAMQWGVRSVRVTAL